MKALRSLSLWLTRQPPLTLALILGLLAALTNLVNIPMLADTVLMLGGVFTMMAALLMAPRYALLATLMGTLGLAISWNNYWVFLWFPLEVLFVGWMVRHKVQVLLADLIFWALVGVPLVYLVLITTTETSSSMQAVILSKQVLNGYIYTLLASFITMLPGVRGLASGEKALPLPSLQNYLTQAFGMICTLCLLGYGLISERNYVIDHTTKVEAKLGFTSQQLADNLSKELHHIEQSFALYARLLGQNPTLSEPQLLAGLLKVDPNLSSVSLLDRQGKVRYSARQEKFQRPLASKGRQPQVDSKSAQKALAQGRLIVAPIAQRSRLTAYPMLSINVPIDNFSSNKPSAILQGVMDLRGVEATQQKLFQGNEVDYLVVDEQSQVLFSSKRLELPLLQPLASQPKGAEQLPLPLDGRVLALAQGEKEFFHLSQTLHNDWQVIALADAERELELLQARYFKWALFIVMASLAAVFLGKLLANLFTQPLLHLLDVDRNATLADVKSQFYYREHQQLFSSLKRKSKALKVYYESLEQQVHTRTQELQILNERMNRVLQSSSDGILEIDGKGRVTFVNQTLADWLGRQEHEILGLSADRLLFPVDGVQTLEQCVHEARFTQSLAQGEGSLKIGDQVMELEFNVAPSLHKEGQVGAVVMLHDISSRKELQRTIEQARYSAEQASRAKSDFVANMSHEIRTPLNAISGLVQLFDRNNLSQEQHQFLRRMEHGTDLLKGIVNDILDFSKIESGHLELEQQAFDIEAVMSHLKLLLSARAQQSQLRLSCQVKDGVPRGLIGDPLRLTQVMMNLISNAIKFTPQGSVMASVSCLPDTADDKVKVRFEVSDTGIGIAKEKLETLFLPFTQGDSATTRQYGGTGLGLAISQRLVTLMGSSLEVSSILGHGSKFWFDILLPVASPNQTLLQTPSTQLSTPNVKFAPQQVLIVEDNEVNLQITRLMLERVGLIPVLASSGEQALRIIQQNPDLKLILMDLQMPEQDGLEVTAIIRRHPELQELPIVALTAHASLADKQRCLAGGMQDHLTKPVNMHELIRVLSRFLSYRTLSSGEAKSRIPAPTAQNAAEQLDYFLRHFGQLAEELDSLVAFEAWADASALLEKALKATTSLPYQAIRSLIFSLQSELSQGRCEASQVEALAEQLKTLRKLNQPSEQLE